MAKACKCDVCGQFYEEREYIPDISVTKYNCITEKKIYLDLCDSCQEKLEKWLRQEKEDLE